MCENTHISKEKFREIQEVQPEKSQETVLVAELKSRIMMSDISRDLTTNKGDER